MQKSEVICDGCDKDISSTGNCEGYRIVLANERKPSRGGAVTLMAVQPPLERSYHFCGVNCLGVWAAEQINPYTGNPIIPNKHPDYESGFKAGMEYGHITAQAQMEAITSFKLGNPTQNPNNGEEK